MSLPTHGVVTQIDPMYGSRSVDRATRAVVELWTERGYWESAPKTHASLKERGQEYAISTVKDAYTAAKKHKDVLELPDWPTFRARSAGEPPKWTAYLGNEPEWRQQQRIWYLKYTGENFDGKTSSWKAATNKFNQKPADQNAIKKQKLNRNLRGLARSLPKDFLEPLVNSLPEHDSSGKPLLLADPEYPFLLADPEDPPPSGPPSAPSDCPSAPPAEIGDRMTVVHEIENILKELLSEDQLGPISVLLDTLRTRFESTDSSIGKAVWCDRFHKCLMLIIIVIVVLFGATIAAFAAFAATTSESRASPPPLGPPINLRTFTAPLHVVHVIPAGNMSRHELAQIAGVHMSRVHVTYNSSFVIVPTTSPEDGDSSTAAHEMVDALADAAPLAFSELQVEALDVRTLPCPAIRILLRNGYLNMWRREDGTMTRDEYQHDMLRAGVPEPIVHETTRANLESPECPQCPTRINPLTMTNAIFHVRSSCIIIGEARGGTIDFDADRFELAQANCLEIMGSSLWDMHKVICMSTLFDREIGHPQTCNVVEEKRPVGVAGTAYENQTCTASASGPLRCPGQQHGAPLFLGEAFGSPWGAAFTIPLVAWRGMWQHGIEPIDFRERSPATCIADEDDAPHFGCQQCLEVRTRCDPPAQSPPA